MKPNNIANILGVPIAGLTKVELVELARERIVAGQKTLFTTANAHSIVCAQKLPEFFGHFQEADVVLPDGMLPVWAARLLGEHIPERVSGPEFTESFIALAETAGLSIFFLGATMKTLSRIEANCLQKHPRIKIAGRYAPPFGEWDERTDNHIIDSINCALPDILFVGMTAPKQELWLSRNIGRLNVKFMIGIGAAFDYMAGVKKQAPKLLRENGLEWFYRLAHEPNRLWRRNLDSIVFIYLLFRQQAQKRFHKSPKP